MKIDRLQLTMTILALLIVPLLIIEHQTTDPTVLLIVWVANALIWLAFVAEYLWGLSRAERKWEFVRTNWFDLAIILLSPPVFVPEALQGVRALRILRLGRLGRLLRLLRLVRVLAVMTRALRTSGQILGKHSFGYILLMVVVFVVGSGAIFVAVEGGEYTLLDGIWWAVATLTTVGYGDIYPKTDAGRIVALVMIIMGLGMMAALTANIAAAFVGSEQKEEENEVLKRLDELNARIAALEDSLNKAIDTRERSGIQS